MTDVAAPRNLTTIPAAATSDTGQTPADLELYRRELTGYCYRMLGGVFDAEDAAQETLVKAWRSLDRFEGRSSLRTWLYRIATNTCLDHLSGRERRARPVELGPSTTVAEATLTERPEAAWLEPAPDGRILPSVSDPAEMAAARETVRLAFVAALQHLPPKQRAVLILREVLRWQATEVAELLGTTVAGVNSALQRARATIDSLGVAETDTFDPLNDEQQELLTQYVDAFERYDMDALTALLHEDATQSMPPYELWLRGHEQIAGWMLGPGKECQGSRMVPTVANGTAAFGQYRPSGPNGEHEPWSLTVIELDGNKISAMISFLDVARWFPLFGLPERLGDEELGSR